MNKVSYVGIFTLMAITLFLSFNTNRFISSSESIMALPAESGSMTNADVRRWIMSSTQLASAKTESGQMYQSSESELAWLSETINGKICAFSKVDSQITSAINWLNYSTSVFLPDRKPSREPSGNERASLSAFKINDHEEFIEPLHGFARHPFAKVGCGGEVNVFNIQYLVLHNQCSFSNVLKPKTILFDMGASEGFAGIQGGIYSEMPEHGGELLPSIPLFMKLYEDRCLQIDEVYAWEMNKHISSIQWWGSLPPAERSKIRFYEVPVYEGTLNEARNGTPFPSSFLQMLRHVAKAEDFVVVKLDIDTPDIEQVIVEIIAEQPETAALIDELFFEYHFNTDADNVPGWNCGRALSNCVGNVDTALALLHRLRTLGIRAHFWV